MRGSIRFIELAGAVLLLVVLAIVGSRVSAEGSKADPTDTSNVGMLIARLRMANLSVTSDGDADNPYLSVPGQAFLVNGERIEIYSYHDAWSAEADATRLAAHSGVDPDLSDWIDAPHLFRDDRLLVIHVGGSTELNQVLGTVLNSGERLHDVH